MREIAFVVRHAILVVQTVAQTSVCALLLIWPVRRFQSSPTPSNTPSPTPTAPAHTPPIPHPESPAHSSSHPQNSALRTRTLPRHRTIPHSSAASASPRQPPLHAPQNSHTQTPPAAPLTLWSAEILDCCLDSCFDWQAGTPPHPFGGTALAGLRSWLTRSKFQSHTEDQSQRHTCGRGRREPPGE